MPTGGEMDNVGRLKELVMAEVDLNVVRELLGHTDIKMTLRYAHLAPSVKAAAVEKLTQGNL